MADSNPLPEQVTPRIVEGVGISVNQGGQKTDFALHIEQVMSGVVQECINAGITDPEEIRSRMLAARDFVVQTGIAKE